MARVYTAAFKFVTISAAQDLVALKGSSGKTVIVRRVYLYMNDTTLQTAQGLRLNLKYASATITLGSGGSSATARPHDQGDSAFSGTARVNDTTPATTSGGFTDITPAGGHNYQGFDYTWPRGEEPVFGLNEGVVWELLSTVSGTCNFSGGVTVAETGS
jgi:hypothetical protein